MVLDKCRPQAVAGPPHKKGVLLPPPASALHHGVGHWGLGTAVTATSSCPLTLPILLLPQLTQTQKQQLST